MYVYCMCVPGLCQSLRYFSKSSLQEGLNGRRKTTHTHYPELVVSVDAYKNTITLYGRGTDTHTLVPVIHPTEMQTPPTQQHRHSLPHLFPYLTFVWGPHRVVASQKKRTLLKEVVHLYKGDLKCYMIGIEHQTDMCICFRESRQD